MQTYVDILFSVLVFCFCFFEVYKILIRGFIES